jgi:hypothetical protein
MTKAEHELKLFLEENPHMVPYQLKLQASLLKCETVEDRLNVLKYMLEDILLEWQIETENLKRIVDKLSEIV